MSKNTGVANTIQLCINGDTKRFDIDFGETLMQCLRDAGHYSVKNGCDEGVCGACNVILGDGRVTRSCLTLAAKCDGEDVMTVEGLLGDDGSLHPLQEEFLEHGAAQCGFCIPGVLLSSYHLLQRDANPTEADIAAELSGNICRCTGYVQQIEAVQAAAKRLPEAEDSIEADR